MTAADVANLVWSLGELGATKAEVTQGLVRLTGDDVASLSGPLNSRLLTTLVTMGYFDADEPDLRLLNDLMLGMVSKVGGFGVTDVRRR